MIVTVISGAVMLLMLVLNFGVGYWMGLSAGRTEGFRKGHAAAARYSGRKSDVS